MTTPDDLLLDRYAAGDCTPAERALVERWLAGDARRAELLVSLRRAPEGASGVRWRTDAAWDRLRSAIRESADAPDRGRVLWRPLAWAAAATLLVAAGTLTMMRLTRPGGVITSLTATTGRGETQPLRLGDGTLVTLGALSALRYDATGATRRVELSGVATFRVTHDAARPFTVRAGSALVRDLGTAFVVRAYPNDSGVAVAVSEGRVRLRRATGADTTAEGPGAVSPGGADAGSDLVAGDVGTLAGGHLAVIHRADVARFAAFATNRLAFDDQPLSDVAAELPRWFDVEVRIPDPALARRRLTAEWGRPTLERVLTSLSETFGLRVERSGRVVTLRAGTTPETTPR